MYTKPLIRVIGSINVDITTIVPKIPDPGETITAISRIIGAGGKGANQAVACGRAAFISRTKQDADVEMIGAVGAEDPQYLSLLQPSLEKSGVITTGIIGVDNTFTGTSIILVDKSANGENSILFNPGANYEGMRDLDQILERAIAGDPLTGCKRYPEIVVMQGEIPLETTIGLLQHFSQSTNKTCVVFNPAPMYPDGIPAYALHGLAVLILNETECTHLAQSIQVELFKSNSSTGTLSVDQLEEFAHHLKRTVRVKNIIVTLGSKGAYFMAESGTSGVIPAAGVKKIVDTTSAGDTFTGFLTVQLAKHIGMGLKITDFDMANAIIVANSAAATCVQHSGSLSSIPFGFNQDM